MSEMTKDRMRTSWGTRLACAATLAASAAAGQSGVKGIVIENKSQGITWNILLDRGSERLIAPATYPFKTGDKLSLQLKLNRAGYVYILNRTLSGNPEALKSKGIEIIQSEDLEKPAPSARTPYKLVYPRRGVANFLPANEMRTIGLRMDQFPGVEKMLIVVHDKPVDFSHEFNLQTGEMITVTHEPPPAPKPPAPPAGGGSGARVDTNDDALARLNRKLIDFGDNAEVAHSDSQRGIILPAPGKTGSDPGLAPPPPGKDDPNGYGSGKDPNKPWLVDVTLKHYPR